MKRFLAWAFSLAAFVVPLASAAAATIGPPAGLYSFGTITSDPDVAQACKTVNGIHFNVFLGSGGVFVGGASSVLRSNGAGAVKFSTSLPFDLNEASATGQNDYYYGSWAIMTFNTGSTTAGTITFDQVIPSPGAPAIPNRTIRFTGYAQTFTASTGQLKFNLVALFPNCPIVVVGSYEQ